MWSTKFDKCVNCQKDTSAHASKGVCQRCYMGIRLHGEDYKVRKETDWSNKYDKCISCKKTDNEHSSKGLCRRCYNREYFRKRREEYRENLYKFYGHKFCKKILLSYIDNMRKGAA